MGTEVEYKYSQSSRRDAYRYLSTAMFLPVSVFIMVSILGREHLAGAIPYIVWGTIALSAFLFLVFVIPGFMKNTLFCFEVTQDGISCTNESESFNFALSDVRRVYQIKSASMNMYVEEYIELHNKQVYKIPDMYGINMHKVIKTILKLNPKIKRTNNVKY